MSNPPSDGTKGPVSVRGLAVDDPANIPVRLEIRDMARNYPDLWNLYLLGLERFKNNVNENAPLSYFQIAGIHGMPYTTWPNQRWNNEMKEVMERGFCTHSSILFLTWHRPYLALFETQLYQHVNAVANDFLQKDGTDRYIAVAKKFRMPYWDWALPAHDDVGVFPKEALPSAQHRVTRPGGKTDILSGNDNPLASYKFGDVGKAYRTRDGDVIDRAARVHATVRHYDARNPEQDLENVFNAFVSQPEALGQDDDGNPVYYKGRNLTERVLYLLQSYETFAPMSYNLWLRDQGLDNYGSIEDIHNSIHTYVGGQGHMADPAVAAFDPIFWCHHTNIDRLFAIWQAIRDDPNNPDTYVVEKESLTGTWTTRQGDPENDQTPLTPFHVSQKAGDFWTSEGVRSTSAFGYMYPETILAQQDIPARLQELYPTASFANLVRRRVVSKASAAPTKTGPAPVKAGAHAPEAASSAPAPAVHAEAASPVKLVERRAESHALIAQTPIDTKTVVAALQARDSQAVQAIATEAKKVEVPQNRSIDDLVTDDNKYLEWLVDVKAEKHALGGDYFVHFFIGDPDDANPSLYTSNPTHVAAFSTFGQNATTGCEKCKLDQSDRISVTGQIPLTMALVERYLAGHVEGLSPEHVVPFLQAHLHWRVTSLNGTPRPRGDVGDLLVGVVTNEVTLPPHSSTALPRYAPNVVPRPEVTTNRNGDARGDGTGYTGGPVTAAA